MGQGEGNQRLNIIRLDIVAAFDRRARLCAPVERQCAAWAGPQRQFTMGAGGLNQGNNIVAQALIDMHLPDPLGQLGNGDAFALRRQRLNWMASAQVDQHGALLGSGEIAQPHLEEKAIQLRFGQGEGAFVLDRILGCQDQKGAGQHPRHPIDRHLAFAHTFEQRRLCARRRPVDLVGEQNIGKGRAGDKLKVARLLVKDAHAGYITGQEIGRTLEPPKVDAQRHRQRTRQHRLADARHILQQHMPLTEQRNHQRLHHLSLADDHLFHIPDNRLGKPLNLLHVVSPLVGYSSHKDRLYST